MAMTHEEREVALVKMEELVKGFYWQTTKIGVHPFIEFCGLMSEYIKACQLAHNDGIDFTECNKHNGEVLPLKSYMSDYINDKLECIFSGAKILDVDNEESDH